MPLQLYAKHEAEILLQPPGIAADITKTKAFQLLREDPESRLIINCRYPDVLTLQLTDII